MKVKEKVKEKVRVSTNCDNEIDNVSNLNIIFNNISSRMKLYEYDFGKCKFELLEKIIKYHLSDENISIGIIKDRLIEEHKKLQMSDHNINSKGNEHSLLKGYVTKRGDKLCKVFSLLYAKKEEKEKFNEIEYESNDDKQNEIIKGYIMNDNYNVTDFEIFLILKSYNIPALIISPGFGNGTILNKKRKIFNTDIDSNEYYVIANRKNKKVYLYTYDNSMKINKNLMLNEKLKKSVTNIEKYIKDSVKKMEDKRIENLNKDKNQKNKRRGAKTKAKKIGKGKLPSE